MKNNLYFLILCLIIFLCCFFIIHVFIDYSIEFPSETLRNMMEQQEQGLNNDRK